LIKVRGKQIKRSLERKALALAKSRETAQHFPSFARKRGVLGFDAVVHSQLMIVIPFHRRLLRW